VQAIVQEFRDRETQLKHEIAETEAAVRTAVFATGASAFGTHLHASIMAPRMTWDKKGMAAYSALHPDVLASRTAGEPRVTMRARGQRRDEAPRGAPHPSQQSSACLVRAQGTLGTVQQPAPVTAPCATRSSCSTPSPLTPMAPSRTRRREAAI
jgi:hypothetical protein